MLPSSIFRCACFACICGVIASVFLYDGSAPFFLFLALLGASAIVVLARKKKAVCVPAFLCAIFFFGMARAGASGIVFEDETRGKKEFFPVSVEGVIYAEPSVTQSRHILPVRVDNINGIDREHAPRTMRVFAPLMPTYRYGDNVYVRCLLIRAKNFPCVQADIQILSHGGGNRMVAFLLKGKEIFLHTIQAHLSQPHAHFLGALLLGDRSGFPAWLTDAFVRSGIVHIVAISGYNITIMIVSIYALLRACAFGRKQSFWCIVFGVICFVILTGSSASVVRAALMGICALIAQYVGRKNDTGNAIFCAAALMVAWNPAVLFDIGFQLSFAATLGLVYIAPIFENLFEKISNAYGIKTLMLQTISAMLATTPLLVYFFGRFSVIALVVNMLVLPLIPFVMAFGFFWAILAVCGEMLGSLVTLPLDMLIQIASWPVWFLLSYIMIISQWFAHIPWASTDVSLGAWSWVAVYAAYASMVWCVWAYRSMKRLKKERAMI